jgi:hypothetical protein
MQDQVESDEFDYFDGDVDVTIEAPPSMKSQNFMRLQTDEHFESMAQKKIDR